ncbi:hypothetical protein PYCC9005_003748 [Savitreella phatthalungensis]
MARRPLSMPVLSDKTHVSTPRGMRKTSKPVPQTPDEAAASALGSAKTRRIPPFVPADFTTSSTSQSPVSRSPHIKTVSVAELFRRPGFREDCSCYGGKDEVQGAIVALALLDSRQHLQVLFLSAAGRLSMVDFVPPTMTYSDDPLTGAVRAAFLHYWTNFERLPGQCYHKEIDRSETTARRLADSLHLLRLPHGASSIEALLAPKQGRYISIDAIVPDDASVLGRLLPEESIRLSPREPNDPHHDVEFGMRDNVEKRENLLAELVHTERSYVTRLQHLLQDYAQPLRAMNRKGRGLLGNYEINTVFPPALETILLLNTALLRNLEQSDSLAAMADVMTQDLQTLQKSYGRYLEDSAAQETMLRDCLSQPKFKEFCDGVRSSCRQPVGVRELIMEPVTRIPRYALLLTNVVRTMTPDHPAADTFVAALTLCRAIGSMKVSTASQSQERIIRLGTLCQDWPPQLVSANIQVGDMFDAEGLELAPPHGKSTAISLLLLHDRLIVVNRAHASIGVQDILSSNRKGELQFLHMVSLDALSTAVDEQGLLHVINRLDGTLHRYRLHAKKNIAVDSAIRAAQVALKLSDHELTQQHLGHELVFELYNSRNWAQELAARQAIFRLWEDVDDGNHNAFNFVVSFNERNEYCLRYRHGNRVNVLQVSSSLQEIRQKLFDSITRIHQASWLNPGFIGDCAVAQILSSFAETLLGQNSKPTLAAKSRPHSPVKAVSSFLSGIKDRGKNATHTMAKAVLVESPELSRAPAGHQRGSPGDLRHANSANMGDDDRLAVLQAIITALCHSQVFTEADFESVTSREFKHASLVARDPMQQSLNLSGVSTKVLIAAMRIHLKTMFQQSVLSAELAVRLSTELRATAAAAIPRRACFRAAVDSMPNDQAQCLLLLSQFGSHVLGKCSLGARHRFVLCLSEMLVPSKYVTSFLQALETILVDTDAFVPDNGHLTKSGPQLVRNGKILFRSPLTAASTLTTPDLIDDYSGSDPDSHSVARTRSFESMNPPGCDLPRDNMLGIAGLSSTSKKDDKDLPQLPSVEAPVEKMTTLRELCENEGNITAVKPQRKEIVSMIEPRQQAIRPPATPQEIYREFAGFFANAGKAKEEPMSQISATTPTHERTLTPSRLPVPSPSHSRQQSVNHLEQELSDEIASLKLDNRRPSSAAKSLRRSSGIPRKASSSLALGRAFSGSSLFNFDAEGDLDLALHFIAHDGDVPAPRSRTSSRPNTAEDSRTMKLSKSEPRLSSATSALLPSRSTIRREFSPQPGDKKRRERLDLQSEVPEDEAEDCEAALSPLGRHQRTGSRGDALRRLSKQLAALPSSDRDVSPASAQHILATADCLLDKPASAEKCVTSSSLVAEVPVTSATETVLDDGDDDDALEPIDRPQSPGKLDWPAPVLDNVVESAASVRSQSPTPSSIAPSHHFTLHPAAVAKLAATAARRPSTGKRRNSDVAPSVSAYSSISSGGQSQSCAPDAACQARIRALEDEVRLLKLRVRHLIERSGSNASTNATNGTGYQPSPAPTVNPYLAISPTASMVAPRPGRKVDLSRGFSPPAKQIHAGRVVSSPAGTTPLRSSPRRLPVRN